MTDTNGGTSAPQTDTDAQLQRPGGFMRARREEAGMSQAQVGEALHLTVHYVKSLENDDYGKLPGLTFVKGYLRAYARLLKLDENVVLEIYDRYVGSQGLQETVQQHTLRVRRRNDQAILWALVAGLILVVGLGAGWWFFGREESAAPRVISSPQRAPAVQATAPAGSNTGNAATSTGGNDISTSQVPASTIAAPVVTNTTATDAIAVQTGSNLVSAEEAALTADLAADPVEPAGVDVLDAAQGEGVLPPEGANVLITEDGPVVVDETGAVAAEATAAVGEGIASDPAANAATQVTTAAGADANPEPAGNVPATSAPQSATAAPAAPATTPETIPETTPAPAQNEAGQGTVVPGDGAAIGSPAGSRRVELSAAGDDRLELQFSGNSWVEVDDGRRVRLYGNMLQGGDTLSIKAGAPFYVLLGDATGVAVQLNGQAFGIASTIRSDNTARVRISAEGVSPWMVQ